MGHRFRVWLAVALVATVINLRWLLVGVLLGLVFIGTASLSKPCAAAEAIPPAAAKYRGDLVRSAHQAWGLNAPVATFAAQVNQESGWNPAAVSRVGARGLAQFMPATAKWISGMSPDLAARTPENPVWALRALTLYDKWLWDRVQADAACDRMAMALSSYNGGLGWVIKDKALAAKSGASRNLWWGQVERYNAGRSAPDFAENRGYPVRILKVLEPRYTAWGQGSCA